MSFRFVTLAVLLSFGCASSTVTFMDENDRPVTLEQEFRGRGCIAISRPKDGSVDIIVQQDGSSDWAGVRALPVLAQVALATLFGNRDTESEGFTGPSDVQGCAGLFESTIYEDDQEENSE